MGVIFRIWILSLMAVFVIDYSGFIPSIEEYLRKMLKMRMLKIPKPFSCSLCLSIWSGLFYLLIANQLTFINLMCLTLISALTPVTLHFIYTVRDIADRILDYIDVIVNWFKNY